MEMIIILLIVVAFLGVGTFVAIGGSKKPSNKKKKATYPTGPTSAPVVPPNQKKSGGTDSVFAPFFQLLGINGLRGGTNADSVQELIPLDDIQNGMIIVHDNNGVPFYRMMVECGSINYMLKTDDEQNLVDSGFQGAITGWNFPWGFYIQTRRMDGRKFLQDTNLDISATVEQYPQLTNYGKIYLDYLQRNMSEASENLIIKKNYIVVACNDAGKQTELDAEDLKEWAHSKLLTECNLVISNMRRIGIAAHRCETEDLYAIMFEALSKKEGGAVDGISKDEFMAGTVSGNPGTIPKEDLVRIIQEFTNQLDVCIINHPNADPEDREQAIALRREAVQMKQAVQPHEDDLERLFGAAQ